MTFPSRKKSILILIVLFESVIGSTFLFHFYTKNVSQKQFVAEINKENIIIPEESRFKFYTELKPDSFEEEQPEWLSEKATYTYNSDGIHDRYNYSLEAEENTLRIITLGDSFTFGHFVNTADNWTELLEDSLNNHEKNTLCPQKKFEVINLGMAGFDVPYIVERYKKVGKKYNPDLVIWFESASGFSRLNELMQPLIKQCEEKNGELKKNKQQYFDCWVESQAQILDQYKWEGLGELINQNLDIFFQEIDPQKVVFFTFDPSVLDGGQMNAWKTRVEKYPLAQFRALIPDITKRKEILPDGHPNKKGHKTIEEAIFTSLQSDLKNLCKN